MDAARPFVIAGSCVCLCAPGKRRAGRVSGEGGEDVVDGQVDHGGPGGLRRRCDVGQRDDARFRHQRGQVLAHGFAFVSAYSSATIHEAQGRLGALESAIKPVDHRMSLCGPAFTLQCAPRDNLMLQTAIGYARPGDVIVVSAGAYEEAGSFGDALANACRAKGLGGLITDTGVRDTEDLRALGFPVFSRSISIKGTVKETVGPMCEPVTVGGVLVRPGDVMRADADGVVVVRREDAAEVATASQERAGARGGRLHRRVPGGPNRRRDVRSRAAADVERARDRGRVTRRPAARHVAYRRAARRPARGRPCRSPRARVGVRPVSGKRSPDRPGCPRAT